MCEMEGREFVDTNPFSLHWQRRVCVVTVSECVCVCVLSECECVFRTSPQTSSVFHSRPDNSLLEPSPHTQPRRHHFPFELLNKTLNIQDFFYNPYDQEVNINKTKKTWKVDLFLLFEKASFTPFP